MQLKVFIIDYNELQKYLDKYQDKIKHIVTYCRGTLLLVIDVS